MMRMSLVKSKSPALVSSKSEISERKTIDHRYWNLPEATAKEFTSDGWFKTGDVAILSALDSDGKGQYKILGRNSADIIKSGGEKLSAIEIETAILELPGMKDCAVVGVPDEEWGQLVCVEVRQSSDSRLECV